MDGLILLCWVIFFGSVGATGPTLRHLFELRRQRRRDPNVEAAFN
jgi:hypothetical protein